MDLVPVQLLQLLPVLPGTGRHLQRTPHIHHGTKEIDIGAISAGRYTV